MRRFLQTTWRGLYSNGARTGEDVASVWLRGRTYAIPFDRVWRQALELGRDGLPRWHLQFADDYEGVIRVEVAAASLRPALQVTIRIGLGIDAQTRVDAEAQAPGRRADLGASARALARFFAALDQALARPAAAAGSGAEVA